VQFKPKNEFRRIGLLEPNRFGKYLFDNDREKTLERLKKHKEEYFTNKAFYTGIPKVQLQRQEGWVLAEAKNLNLNRSHESNRSGNPRGRGFLNQGNARGFNRGFQGGGRPKQKFKNGPRGGRPSNSNFPNQWSENHDQPSTSGQGNQPNNQRGTPRNKKRGGGAGGGRGGGQQ
jgi:hypothetical protein